jgi:copper chaperone CopZ
MQGAALLGCALALCAAAGCRRYDIRTAYIHIPEMAAPADVETIRGVLAQIPGVRAAQMELDAPARTIRVPYDSIELSLKNIEFAIAESGYAANDVPARR